MRRKKKQLQRPPRVVRNASPLNKPPISPQLQDVTPHLHSPKTACRYKPNDPPHYAFLDFALAVSLLLKISSFFTCNSICISSISLTGSSGTPKPPLWKSSVLALLCIPFDAARPTLFFSRWASHTLPGELKKPRQRAMPMWTKNYGTKTSVLSLLEK